MKTVTILTEIMASQEIVKSNCYKNYFIFAMTLNFANLKKSMEEVKNMETVDLGPKIKGNVELNCPPKGNWDYGCALRMSYALNHAGLPIPFNSNSTTVSGIDNVDGKKIKLWYYYRVSDITIYLRNLCKNCTKVEYDPKKDNKKKIDEFKNKKGIIIFQINFSDAGGHVELIENGQMIGYTVDGHDFNHYINHKKLVKAELYEIE